MNNRNMWKSIDTAPKDGTRILANDMQYNNPSFVCWWDNNKSGWVSDLAIDFGGTEDPKMWIPLPKPNMN